MSDEYIDPRLEQALYDKTRAFVAVLSDDDEDAVHHGFRSSDSLI
jgi:hypothetical protein